MKKPLGIWFLLSAGVLWLSIQNVYGLKATELIFRKSTTTSTTEAPSNGEQAADGVSTEAAVEVANVTIKSNFTGIPQLDYIYDPNLPRELNGYNLSSYPFYNGMPDNITFKCDGLHDGFYASIAHKCQVYHQCLSDIRYDFLCANYTAFDQRTFICHFVSEVDCNNSVKFWHRNDALYKSPTTTTTTIKPTPIIVSPALTGSPKRPPPPIGRRRRPLRRRPQYEYYDDEEYDDNDKEDDYEEPPPRRRRKRPRPRPRPVYEDDYEEYEDKYERRGSGRRNEERKREYEDEDKRMSENPNNDDKQERRNDKRKPYDERRHKDDRRHGYEQDDEEEDDYSNRRRPTDKRRPNHDRPRKSQRPVYDDDVYDDSKSDDRPHTNEQPHKKTKAPSENEKPHRGHHDDDVYDDERAKEHEQNERPRKNPKVHAENDGVLLVKPLGASSVFSQPRMPPRIKPPAPKHAQSTTTPSKKQVSVKKPIDNAEYYDDYEDEVPVKVTTSSSTTTAAPVSEANKRHKLRTTHKPPVYEDEYDDSPIITTTSKKPDKEVGTRFASPKFVPKENRSRVVTTTTTTTEVPTTITTTTTTTTTTEAYRERNEPVIRVVKRPFLPSRGGNPYSVRGLQPIGAKALDASRYETNSPEDEENHTVEDEAPLQNGRQFPTIVPMSPPAFKETLATQPIVAQPPEPNQPQTEIRLKYMRIPEDQPRSKPKPQERNPLDIIENEYDVTLNDALNPTIPNLPIRNFPSAFGSSSDYVYNAVQRPGYEVVFNQPVESYQPKTIKQKDEIVVAQPQNYQNQFYSNNNQNFRPSPQVTQARTRGFYNVF